MRMDMLVRDINVFNSYFKDLLKGMQPSRMESSIILENVNWMPSSRIQSSMDRGSIWFQV